jgi:hypothetical protein
VRPRIAADLYRMGLADKILISQTAEGEQTSFVAMFYYRLKY